MLSIKKHGKNFRFLSSLSTLAVQIGGRRIYVDNLNFYIGQQEQVLGAGYPSLPTMTVEEFYQQRYSQQE